MGVFAAMTDRNALNLRWTFGFNLDYDSGTLVDLTSEGRQVCVCACIVCRSDYSGQGRWKPGGLWRPITVLTDVGLAGRVLLSRSHGRNFRLRSETAASTAGQYSDVCHRVAFSVVVLLGGTSRFFGASLRETL